MKVDMDLLMILVPSCIFSLFLMLELGEAQVNFYSYMCSTSNDNYTTNSVYEVNLNQALTNLSSTQAASNRPNFYKLTVGSGSDQVYALYLCRGDVPPQVCKSCIDDASNLLPKQKCPNVKAAFILYLECMLRYTNLPNYSIGQDTSDEHWLTSYSGLNELNTTQFPQVLSNTLNELITKAVSNKTSPAPYFETGEVKWTSSQTLYCLVQCTPDITEFDCNRCLQGALAYYPGCCGVGSLATTVMGESCQMRYGNSPFYYTLPASPDTPPSQNTTNNGGIGRGRSGRTLTIIIISVVVSCSVLAMFAALIVIRFLNAKKKMRIEQGRGMFDDGGGGHVESRDQLTPIPLDIITTSTQGFSEANKLGEGGFGPVYKGTLANGKEIAVKRLSRSSGQGIEELQNEVSLIAQLQHRNLVRLLGCCLEGNESLLIYEFLPNKSLDFFIFDSTRAAQLDWSRRFSIIDGIARGLLYLHEDSRLRVIHRDLKASNILLDHEMNPKISDFGLARTVEVNQSVANASRIAGTHGYMAPEYSWHRLFSVKSDVFSFGVLLLEIICGKRNWSFDPSEPGQSLIISVWKEWTNGNGLELMDPSLRETFVSSEVLKCIHIGLLCVQVDPADRPTMSKVVLMLRSDTMILPRPGQPSFSFIERAKQEELKHFSNNVVTISNISGR